MQDAEKDVFNPAFQKTYHTIRHHSRRNCNLIVGILRIFLFLSCHLFPGAMLTATSVGITTRVFQGLGKLKCAEARIVPGAAAIDDIPGLSILAVIKAIVESGNIDLQGVAWITLKAVAFLGAAILLGQMLTQWLGKTFSRIYPGVGKLSHS